MKCSKAPTGCGKNRRLFSARTVSRAAIRLKAISDKRRLDILKLVKAEPLCGQDLSERIGLSPATISHHMSSLVSAGFINVDKQNPRVSYSINKEFIKGFLQNLTNTLL